MRRAALFSFGAVLSALALPACDERGRVLPEEPAVTAPGARVDAIKESPERFYGKTVRIVGEVDEIYSDRSFELEGTDWAFNDNITVLTKTPVGFGGAGLTDDDEVVVVGIVRPFVVADVERDLGWDVDADVEIRLSKRPVIVAQAIRKVGEPGRWPPETTDTITSTLAVVVQSDPAMLAGRKVDLRRERVQAVTGKGLWVGPGRMGQVFVLPGQLPADVQAGDWVRVTGTMQRMPKDAVKTWDLPSRMEGMVTEDMVFVDAATVTELAQRAGNQPSR